MTGINFSLATREQTLKYIEQTLTSLAINTLQGVNNKICLKADVWLTLSVRYTNYDLLTAANADRIKEPASSVTLARRPRHMHLSSVRLGLSKDLDEQVLYHPSLPATDMGEVYYSDESYEVRWHTWVTNTAAKLLRLLEDGDAKFEQDCPFEPVNSQDISCNFGFGLAVKATVTGASSGHMAELRRYHASAIAQALLTKELSRAQYRNVEVHKGQVKTDIESLGFELDLTETKARFITQGNHPLIPHETVFELELPSFKLTTTTRDDYHIILERNIARVAARIHSTMESAVRNLARLGLTPKPAIGASQEEGAHPVPPAFHHQASLPVMGSFNVDSPDLAGMEHLRNRVRELVVKRSKERPITEHESFALDWDQLSRAMTGTPPVFTGPSGVSITANETSSATADLNATLTQGFDNLNKNMEQLLDKLQSQPEAPTSLEQVHSNIIQDTNVGIMGVCTMGTCKYSMTALSSAMEYLFAPNCASTPGTTFTNTITITRPLDFFNTVMVLTSLRSGKEERAVEHTENIALLASLLYSSWGTPWSEPTNPQIHLRVLSELDTRISFIRLIPKGESIPEQMRVGLIDATHLAQAPSSSFMDVVKLICKKYWVHITPADK